MNVPLSLSAVATRAVLTLHCRRRTSYLPSGGVRLQNTHQPHAIVLASRIKIYLCATGGLSSQLSVYLAFIHGVVADVHHRTRVCLGGSV